MTQAEYAKRAGVTQRYISKLVARGVIPVHGPSRRIDPLEADAARARQVSPRMQLPTLGRPSDPNMSRLSIMPVCQGCGGRYGLDCGSSDPTSVCCDECMVDSFGGLSPSQIAARREAEAPE